MTSTGRQEKKRIREKKKQLREEQKKKREEIRAGKRKQNKKQIRKEYLEKRNKMSAAKREKASEKITERLLKMPEVKNAPTVFVYASYKSEVSTKKLIQTLLSEGRNVALPKVNGTEMEFYRISSWDELFPGYQGILEPQVRGEEAVCPHSRDVMLLPGASFDYSGNRIGYGGGYYDRYLEALQGRKPFLVGVAFYQQVYPAFLPAEPHDWKVDYVVTEKKKVKTEEDKEKGYGILGAILEFVFELLLELLDGIG